MGQPPDSLEDLMAIASLLAGMRDFLAVHEAHLDEVTVGLVDVADGLSGVREFPADPDRLNRALAGMNQYIHLGIKELSRAYFEGLDGVVTN